MTNTLIAKVTKRIKFQKKSRFFDDDLYEKIVIQKGKQYERLDYQKNGNSELILVKDEIKENWYPIDYFHV